ncbi:Lrp/AsnC family transcriptional regulator [Mesorhizobium sp.]|uniref:Lrp/AsnC family transcriptional regulator n=1 Tax=Mesorhizobium sp. TaxID=1871066 RepID=UPI0025F859BF|nr:Lrp/AsnC family transcriptional regulator [Mesorhizobium sp.]
MSVVGFASIPDLRDSSAAGPSSLSPSSVRLEASPQNGGVLDLEPPGSKPSAQTATAMDDLDRRILTVLQKNSRLSFAELAKLVDSSTASCIRRLNKLLSTGVIVADISLVGSRALGRSLTVVVTVELDRERPNFVDNFKRAMRAAREVTQCYMVTGDADFVLIVAVEDLEVFDVFARTKLFADPNVRKFKSMITLDRVKMEPSWLGSRLCLST